MGLIGAIVGAAGAVAKNAKLLQDGKITQREAIIDTGKETVGAGVATAVSAAAVGAVGGGFAVSLGVAIVVAIAGKYAWDRAADYVSDSLGERVALRGPGASDDEILSEIQPSRLAASGADQDFYSEST